MFKSIFLAAALVVLLAFTVTAQDDSLYYDLGRVLVKKSNTKTTTIKGFDLEKYQASNLSDAINVWLYGTYSTAGSIVYVVDGNILTDVNVYSIFDIEEVTLVESATTQVSGAGPGKQMVLIKLRTDRTGKKGIEVNGQNSLVDLRKQANLPPGATTTNSVYNQYYISAYRNYKNVRVGVSTEYERDVQPGTNQYGFQLLTPPNFNRLKLNAYVDANLWKGTTLSFTAGYLPQTNRYSYRHDTIIAVIPDTERSIYATHFTQKLFNTDLSIKSNITKGLTNRFSAGYSHSNFREDNIYTYTGTVAQVVSNNMEALNERSHNLVLRDYLFYHGQVAGFDIEPSVNLTYRNSRDTLTYRDSTYFIETNIPPDYGYSRLASVINTKRFIMTPSVDVNYKDMLDIQGGFAALLNTVKDTTPTAHISRIYPFASVSVNLAKVIGLTAIKWQFYASYSKQSKVLTDDYTALSAFSQATLPGAVYNTPDIPNQPLRNSGYQGGMDVGLSRNFSVSYNYEYKYYRSYIDTTVQNDGGPVANTIVATPFNSRVVTTHLSASYNVRAATFSWMTTLTGTESHMEILDTASLNNRFAGYLNKGHRWSGGVTNRFAYKNYFGGVDVLYQVGERPENLINVFNVAPGGNPPLNNNSFTIQNIFFGVRFKVRYTKFVELYANGRNIAQNQSSTITDNRRFYGLGLKAGF
ncbi:MAG: hypothetical protein ACXVI9_00640 [Mucilaginibacter sp.]